MNETNDALDRLKSFCRFVTDRTKPSPKNIAMGILLGGAGLAFVATCARFEWWLGVDFRWWSVAFFASMAAVGIVGLVKGRLYKRMVEG